MELKYSVALVIPQQTVSSNRTFMELKLKKYGITPATTLVLIVPLWN